MSLFSHLPGFGSSPFGNLGGNLFGGGGQGGHLNSLLAQIQQQQALRGVQSLGYQQQGLRSINEGYDKALGNVGAQGLASKMNVESAGAQTQASIGQNLGARGLGNTTVQANLGGLAQGQTAQALAGIDQAMAGAKANLLTQKGLAQNQAYSGLSGLMQHLSGNETGLGQMAWQQMASQPSESQQLLQLLGAFGGLLPMLGGGGGMARAAGAGMQAGGMNPMGQMY